MRPRQRPQLAHEEANDCVLAHEPDVAWLLNDPLLHNGTVSADDDERRARASALDADKE